MSVSQFLDASEFPPGLVSEASVWTRYMYLESANTSENAGIYKKVSNFNGMYDEMSASPGVTFNQRYYYPLPWSASKVYIAGSVVSVGAQFWLAINALINVSPANPNWIQLTGYATGNFRPHYDYFASSGFGLLNTLPCAVQRLNDNIGAGATGATGLCSLDNGLGGLTFGTPLSGTDNNKRAVYITADGLPSLSTSSVTIEPQVASANGTDSLGNASLAIANKANTVALGSAYFWTNPGSTGSGFTQNNFSLFSRFGVGSAFTASEFLRAVPLTAGAVGTPQTGGTLLANWGPIDSTRAGSYTGAAANTLVNVPSITSTSKVIFGLAGGGTYPGTIVAPPTVVSNAAAAARGFTFGVTLANGVAVNYIVVG